MISEPNTPQPVIPFKMPHLTPVLDAPSPLVPESAAFMNFQVFQTEKANLEFMPVKFRTPENRARLVVVKAQCEELEKQVMLERMVAQIAQLRQEIKELKARLRKHGRKAGPIGGRTRKQHLADREAIVAKQAELSKLEEAHAKLSGIATVNELHELTRNQFLKMVGMTVLALTVWNEAAAMGSSDKHFSGFSLTSWSGSWVESSASWASSGDPTKHERITIFSTTVDENGYIKFHDETENAMFKGSKPVTETTLSHYSDEPVYWQGRAIIVLEAAQFAIMSSVCALDILYLLPHKCDQLDVGQEFYGQTGCTRLFTLSGLVNPIGVMATWGCPVFWRVKKISTTKCNYDMVVFPPPELRDGPHYPGKEDNT